MNTFVIDLRDLGHENLLTLIFNTMAEKTRRELIMEATDMVKDIPASDVLVPLQLEETELAPYPEIEYMIIEATSMDKVIRDVNTQLQNGWQTEWGIQVTSWPVTKFYQSMIRWNVDANRDAEPEMPCENSEDGTMGPKPPLSEEVNEDATNWEANW